MARQGVKGVGVAAMRQRIRIKGGSVKWTPDLRPWIAEVKV